jgi:hypothetical protein
MLSARSELGLALIDGYLYACGGTNGDVRLNTIERYSIADNKWTLVCHAYCSYIDDINESIVYSDC